MDILQDLNPAQADAVKTTTGPVLILAGAGSGKTKTLTHRIAYLMTQERVWPNEILAVTFTNKAAKEMRERLAHLVGQETTRSFMPWMGTFHGICVRLLRLDGDKIGIQSNYVIYDEDDRQGLIKQAMKQLSIADKQIKPRAVSSAISNAKNELVGPEEFANTSHYPFQQAVAKIYALYEKMRIDAGALDFDDLLIETVRLFRDQPDIRAKWRAQFKHILIDEYQDTNAAQYAIVKSLVGDDRNICVVGDDWQSIYSWRGADFTNILNFERDFPGAKVIKLEQNYRSTGAILEAAHNVITKNLQRTDKELWTAEPAGAPVQVHPVYDEAEEAYTVVSRIAVQATMGARKYGDFAILYRMNSQSYTLERALLQQRVPYQIIGGVRFYDRKEIKDVIAYLRLLYQPNDRMSFSRIVNVSP
ncbi:MAG TPA: UvrD-helicase domain-containing protein, partial [Candidatus Saccharimonadales bacterium]